MTNIIQALVTYQDLQRQQGPKWVWHLLHGRPHVFHFIQDSVNMTTVVYFVV